MIPVPTLRRLPWYLACVTQLRDRGVEHVSSTLLARELHLETSQIAKDLSYVSISGKRRIGYDVEELQNVLASVLGFRNIHKAVVIGAGSLGAALMRDNGLSRYGLDIIAGFDVSPSLVGTSMGDIPVHHIDDLPRVVAETGARVAILSVPYDGAQQAADICVKAGIRGLWNFTAFRLSVGGEIVVQDTSIYSDLAVMFNRLK